MSIHWKTDFATRDDKIDEQHRQIFRFANKLEDFLDDKEEASDEEVERLLGFLEGYIKSHFQYEEACMLKRSCPFAKQNHDAHKAFIEFFDNAVSHYRKEGCSKEWLNSLHGFIEGWLTSHICRIDVKLRDYP